MVRALVVKLVFLLALISEPMQPVWPVAGFPLLSVCLDCVVTASFVTAVCSDCLYISLGVCLVSVYCSHLRLVQTVCTVFYLRIDSL